VCDADVLFVLAYVRTDMKEDEKWNAN